MKPPAKWSVSLRSDFGLSLLLRAVSVGSMGFLGLVLAKLMEPAQFGEYAHAMAIVSLAAILACLGTETFLLREVGALGEPGSDPGQREALTGFAMGTVVLASVGSVVLVFVGLKVLPNRGLGALGNVELAMALGLVPVLALAGSLKGVAKAERRMFLAQFPESVFRPAILALAVGGLYFGGVRPTTPLVLALHLLAASVALAWLFVQIRPAWPQYRSFKGPDTSWLRACAGLVLVAGAMVIVRRTDVMVLGFLVSESETGAYVLASRLADLVSILPGALSIAIAGRLSHWIAEGHTDILRSSLRQATRTVFLMSALLGIVLMAATPWVLGWFAETYGVATVAMRTLLVAQMINAGFGLTGMLLVLHGEQGWYARILAVGAVGNVLINLALVPRLGMNGAAAATLIITAMWNFAAWHRLLRRRHVDSSIMGISTGRA